MIQTACYASSVFNLLKHGGEMLWNVYCSFCTPCIYLLQELALLTTALRSRWLLQWCLEEGEISTLSLREEERSLISIWRPALFPHASQWCNSSPEDFEWGAMEQDRDWTDVNDGYPWCHRHGRIPLGFERACQCLENLRCSAWALWGSAMMKIAASWSHWTHAEDRDNVRIGNGTASQFLLPVYASVMHSRCARKPDRTRLVRPSMSCRRYGSYELSMAPRQGDVPRNCTKCNGYDSYDSYGVIWTIACHDALVLRKAPSAKLRSLELVCGRLHIEQTTRCFSFLCKHSCRF